MAFTTLSSVTGTAGNYYHFMKNNNTVESAGNWFSQWMNGSVPASGGTPPTSAAAPTNTTTGAIPVVSASGSNKNYMTEVQVTAGVGGALYIVDRLMHVSGLSGTQTVVDTAVSTTALTRYTDGVGVEPWIEVVSAFGGTAATLNYKYTDQDGNTAQASSIAYPGGVPGASGVPTANQIFPLPLAAGDTGVRAVTNYHWSVSTTAAGNFSVVLLKVLAILNVKGNGQAEIFDVFDLGMPEVKNGACLSLIWQPAATASCNVTGRIKIQETA